MLIKILYFYNFLKGGCFGQRRFGLYDALVCGEQPVLGAETFVAFAHDGLLHQTQFFLAMGAFGFLRHGCLIFDFIKRKKKHLPPTWQFFLSGVYKKNTHHVQNQNNSNSCTSGLEYALCLDPN